MFQKIKQIAKLLLPKEKPAPVEQTRHPLDSLVDAQERKANAYLTTSAPVANSSENKGNQTQLQTEMLPQTAAIPGEPTKPQSQQSQEAQKPKKPGSSKTQTKSKPKNKKQATQKPAK